MALTNYARGANFERRIMADLDLNGYFTMRASGSHGIADVVAIKAGEILLVQCKITGTISPADRVALLDLATRAGAVPLIAYRPSPKKFAYRQLIDAVARGGTYQPWTLDVIDLAARQTTRKVAP